MKSKIDPDAVSIVEEMSYFATPEYQIRTKYKGVEKEGIFRHAMINLCHCAKDRGYDVSKIVGMAMRGYYMECDPSKRDKNLLVMANLLDP